MKFVMLATARSSACDRCWRGRAWEAPDSKGVALSAPTVRVSDPRLLCSGGSEARGQERCIWWGRGRGGCSELGRWEVVFQGETDGKRETQGDAAVSVNTQGEGLPGCLEICSAGGRGVAWNWGGGGACPARPLSLEPSHRLGGQPGLPGRGARHLWGGRRVGAVRLTPFPLIPSGGTCLYRLTRVCFRRTVSGGAQRRGLGTCP